MKCYMKESSLKLGIITVLNTIMLMSSSFWKTIRYYNMFSWIPKGIGVFLKDS